MAPVSRRVPRVIPTSNAPALPVHEPSRSRIKGARHVFDTLRKALPAAADQVTVGDVRNAERLAHRETIFPALGQVVALASTEGHGIFVRELMDLLDVIKAVGDPDIWCGVIVPVLR